MFKNIKQDIPASIVVFFVALPLCLGIALASGAPLFSGLIAGIVRGNLSGILKRLRNWRFRSSSWTSCHRTYSIGTLGGFENFLLAVVLGGAIQLSLAY